MGGKTFDGKYASFSEALEDKDVIEDVTMDFRSLCRRLGISPGRLDRKLVREVGMKGAEILSLWRAIHREAE